MADVDVDRLSIEISAKSSGAAKSIGELADAVGSLRAAVRGVAKPLGELSKALGDLANVGNLSNVASSLSQISKLSGFKFSKENAANIASLAKAMADVSSQSDGVGGVGSAVAGLSALSGLQFNRATANNISALVQATRGISPTAGISLAQVAKAAQMFSGVKVGAGVGNQITRVGAALKSIQDTNLDADHVRGIVDTMKQFGEIPKSGLSATVNALARLPKVMQEIHNADFDQIAADAKRLSEALGPLPSQLQNIAVGWNVVNKAFKAANTETGKGVSLFGRLSSMMYKARTIASFTAGLNAAKATVMNFVDEANQYVEDMNLFNVAMDSARDSAMGFAQQVNNLMGINMQDWARGQGTFMTMARGMGIATDQSALMSQQLTQLSYDLASFYNISEQDAMEKVQAGLAGQLRPLRELGYDLSNARIQQDALAWGITKSVSSMTQAEKAMLRYREMLTQVSWAQGDMSRTLQSPANMLRILAAEARNTGVAIGKVFLPMIKAIAPVAIAVMRVLGQLANMLAEFTGGKAIAGIDYSGGDIGDMMPEEEPIEDVADDLGDVGGAADDAADKVRELKREVAGFDELNILPAHEYRDPSSGGNGGGKGGKGGSGGAGDGGMGSFELPTYDFIGDARNMADDLVDEMMKMVERIGGILKPMADYAGQVFSRIVEQARGLPLAEALGNVVANAAGVLSAFGIEAIGILGPLWLAFNVPHTVTQALNTTAGLFNALAGAVEFCGEFVRGFSDTALVPLAAWLGDRLRDALKFALELFEDWGKWFRDNAGLAYEFGQNVGTVVGIVGDFAMAIADLALSALAGIIKGVSDAVQGLVTAFLRLPPGLQQVIVAFALWKGATSAFKAAGINNVQGVVATIIKAFSNLSGRSTSELAASLVGLGTKMLGGVTPSFAAFAGTVTNLIPNIGNLIRAVVPMSGAFTTGAAAVGSLVAQVATGVGIIAGLAVVIHSVRGKLDEWRENLKGTGGILEFVVTIVSTLVDIVDNLIVTVVSIAKAFGDWIMNATPLGDILKGIGDAIGWVLGGIADFTEGLKNDTEQMLGIKDATEEATDATEGHEEALDELNAKLEEEAQRIAETQGKIDEYAASHETFRTALENSGMSSQDFAARLEEQGTSLDEAARSVEDYVNRSVNGFDILEQKQDVSFADMADNFAANVETMRQWTESLSTIEQLFGQEFADFVRNNMGPEYTKALQEALADPSHAKLTEMYETWKGANGQAWSDTLGEYQTGSQNVVSEVGTMAEQVVNKADVSAQMRETATKDANAYAEGFKEAQGAVETAATMVRQAAVKALNGGNGYKESLNAGRNMVGGYGDGIKQAIDDASSKAAEARKAVVQALNGGTGYNEAKDAGKNLLGGYKDGIYAATEAARQQAENARKSIVTALDGGLGRGAAQTAGSNVMGGYKEGLSQQLDASVSVAKSASKQVTEAFASDVSGARSAGTNMANSFAEGLGDGNVAQAAQSLSNDVTNAFDGLADDARYAGQNVSIGLANGIYDNAWDAYNAAYAVADNVRDIIQSAFDINSPSKVTAWMGEMVDAGLGLGIERGAGDVYDSINGLGRGMQGEMNKAVASVPGALDGFSVKSSFGASLNGTLRLEVDSDAITNAVADGFVMGAANVAMARGQDGTQSEMVVMMDGREVARALVPQYADMARTGEFVFDF